jgi:DNA-binding response OmpR family regulator
MVEDPTILVIDDEVEICGFLKDLLTAEGYTVITASDPQEGLEKVEQLRPDLVLLDLKMPKMNGVEVLRRSKRLHATIPVIIMTGYGTMESAMAAMRLGAFDYITKPFDLPHLKALVKDALAHRISGFLEELKSAKDLLSEADLAFLDSIPKCRPEGACLWEAAVRALLLGDAQFMTEWAEEASIPEEDKKNLERLSQIVIDLNRRRRR